MELDRIGEFSISGNTVPSGTVLNLFLIREIHIR